MNLRTKLLAVPLLLLPFSPASPATARDSEELHAARSAAAPVAFWTLPYFLSRSTSATFPMSAPRGTRFIDLAVKSNSPDPTEMVLRGMVVRVAPGETRRFRSNIQIGRTPRLTRFTLKLADESTKSTGSVIFLK